MFKARRLCSCFLTPDSRLQTLVSRLRFCMNSVAAILLAAGRSERMGAFKPLLPFGDKTVIETCIDHLRKGGVETIVVVVGHQGNLIREHLQDLNLSFA